MSSQLPNPLSIQTNRLAGIDVLRGIASLAVCWFHMTNTYSENSLVRSSGQYGWLGVEVFFVLSGFIIPYAMHKGGYTFRHGWKTFVGKRILRIEPPYLLSVLLVLALWHASSMAPGFKGAMPVEFFSAQTLLHLGYLNGIVGYPWLNVVYWTLAIEFQFYLLISFIFGWLGNSNLFAVLLIDASLMATALVFDSEVFVFKYLGLFMFGIAAFQYRNELIDRRMLVLLMVVATLVAGMKLGWLVAFVGLLTSILVVFDLNLGKHKLAIWLGSISFSLYLVHVPIGGRVVNFGKRYVESQTGEALLSLAALLVSLVAAYLFYLMIERPSQGLAARLKYSRQVQNHD
jgi:peptidoglycan/LPS O-acetylase OafA/YrhL